MSNVPNPQAGGSQNPTQNPAGTSSQNPSGLSNPQIDKIQIKDVPAVDRVLEPLTDDNWAVWHERIMPVFRICGVADYVEGKVPRPADASQAKNWDYNDDYAKVIIQNNVSSSQIIYTSQCNTAADKWASLVATYAPRGHQTAMVVMRTLFRTAAADDTNISEHLNTVKATWDCLNMASDKHVQLSDVIFKAIIAQLLPETWDPYTCPYLADDTMSSQQLMGLIREEYHHRVSRSKMSESVNQARADRSTLANRLDAPRGPKKTLNPEKCRQCGKKGHATDKCRYIGQSKCPTCDRFGHTPENCWFKERPPKRKGGKDKNRPGKRPKNENVNVVKEDEQKSSADAPKKGVTFCVVDVTRRRLVLLDLSKGFL